MNILDTILVIVGIFLVFLMVHGSWMLHRRFRKKATLVLFLSQLLLILFLPISGLVTSILLYLYRYEYGNSVYFSFILVFMERILPVLIGASISISYWVFAKNCNPPIGE